MPPTQQWNWNKGQSIYIRRSQTFFKGARFVCCPQEQNDVTRLRLTFNASQQLGSFLPCSLYFVASTGMVYKELHIHVHRTTCCKEEEEEERGYDQTYCPSSENRRCWGKIKQSLATKTETEMGRDHNVVQLLIRRVWHHNNCTAVYSACGMVSWL